MLYIRKNMGMKEYLNKHKGFIISFLFNIFLCICLMFNCKGSEPKTVVKYVPVHDTVTVTKERIIEKTRTLYKRDTLVRVDSIYFLNNDTQSTPQDGTYVQLPIEYNQYSDTIKTDSTSTAIKVDYHGYAAGIDNIYLDHQYNNKITTIYKEPKKVGIVWYLGFSAGYGVQGNVNTGTFGHGPQVGVHAGIGIGGKIK